jgi:hypothetical protein
MGAGNTLSGLTLQYLQGICRDRRPAPFPNGIRPGDHPVSRADLFVQAFDLFAQHFVLRCGSVQFPLTAIEFLGKCFFFHFPVSHSAAPLTLRPRRRQIRRHPCQKLQAAKSSFKLNAKNAKGQPRIDPQRLLAGALERCAANGSAWALGRRYQPYGTVVNVSGPSGVDWQQRNCMMLYAADRTILAPGNNDHASNSNTAEYQNAAPIFAVDFLAAASRIVRRRAVQGRDPS